MAATGTDLTPLYYLVSIAGSLTAGAVAMRKFLSSQRAKWQKEGKQEADLAGSIKQLGESAEANSKATDKNTRAIETLSGEMRNFRDQVTQQMNGLDGRVIRLEATQPPPRRRTASSD